MALVVLKATVDMARVLDTIILVWLVYPHTEPEALNSTEIALGPAGVHGKWGRRQISSIGLSHRVMIGGVEVSAIMT